MSELGQMWQEVHHNRIDLKKVIELGFGRAERWLRECPASDDVVDFIPEVYEWSDRMIEQCHLFCVLAQMGAEPHCDGIENWQDAGRRLVRASIEFLLGAWRDTPMRNQHEFSPEDIAPEKLIYRAGKREQLDWTDNYRPGVAYAAVLSMWNELDQLFTYPDDDVVDGLDFGFMDDRTLEDHAFHVWFAKRMRGLDDTACSAMRERVTRGSRRRPKILLACADAIFEGDPKGFDREIRQYLKMFRAREINVHNTTSYVPLDANLLWHVARRRGIALPSLPLQLSMFITEPGRT